MSARKEWRWYRFKRRYRVEDEVFVRAPSAQDAVSIHWDGYGGVGSAFDDEQACYSTEPDLYEDSRGEFARIVFGRVRRVEVFDVPAWMVNAAVKLDGRKPQAQPHGEGIDAALHVWNYETAKSFEQRVEDAPLRVFMP